MMLVIVNGSRSVSPPLAAGSWVPLTTAVIAGTTALIGYLLTQLSARRDRQSRIYAEALASVRALEELPFRIRRRSSSDPATRAALAAQQSDIFTDLRFHTTYLQVHSKVVGDAFVDLVDRTRRFAAQFREEAWRSPIMLTDEEMTFRFGYTFDNKPELDLCVLAMRRELSLWGFALRWKSRRAVNQLR